MASAPVELVHIQRQGGSVCNVGVAQMQGWRKDHEDAHFLLQEKDAWATFGVMDGHGGQKAAQLAAVELPKRLGAATKGRKNVTGPGVEKVQQAFQQTDQFLYEKLDNGKEQSGSTCVVAGCRKQADGKYSCFVANAGDSRGLMIRRKGKVVVASEDHKPDRADEKERITAAGGWVSSDPSEGCARLDGSLAVSRGFADFTYKEDGKAPTEQKVSCIPELYFSVLDAGDLLILACDGIFDVMTNDELVDMVLEKVDQPGADLGQVAADITRHCLVKDSKDNMTILIAQVGNGVDGDSAITDEVQGLDKIATIEDETVKNLYQKFLEHCDSSGKLPDAARAFLTEKPKAPPARAPQSLSTRERLQKKLESRTATPPKEAQQPEDKAEEDVDLDALAAFVTGGTTLNPTSPKTKKKNKKKSPAKA
jgi:serine/threonine protein phosphatase PrpC